MNRRGLLFGIIAFVVILLLVVGGLFYYQLKKNGVRITSGNFVVDINYNSSGSSGSERASDYFVNESLNDTSGGDLKDGINATEVNESFG